MKQNLLESPERSPPYQDGVSLVAVLAREGCVDRQADAVPDDGGQDEEVERLPLD